MKRRILQFILGAITKKIIRKYNPKVIAITGSVGKTLTKNTISLFLEKYFLVRKSAGNLNTEFGVPLVFIGKEEGGGNSVFSWIKIILSGIKILIFKNKKYPEVIIVEMGADKPGDISYLTGLAKPHVGVITMIGESPVHLQNYSNFEELVLEKSQIIRNLGEEDYAVLNFDDQRIREIRKDTQAKVFYFGFNEGVDVRFDNFEHKYNNGRPIGSTFDVLFKTQKKRIYLSHCFGKSFPYAITAALSCGLCFGINFDRALEIFKDLRPEKGRMNLIEGKNNSYILDDSYNASPSSVKMALETLSSLSAQRRIVILGDMKELGVKSQKSHEEIGEIVFGLADILVTVGQEAERIRKKAREIGFAIENMYHFQDSIGATETVKEMIKSGDLIIVKGSQSMRMEKITESLMKEPDKAKELLVRQDKFWKENDN